MKEKHSLFSLSNTWLNFYSAMHANSIALLSSVSLLLLVILRAKLRGLNAPTTVATLYYIDNYHCITHHLYPAIWQPGSPQAFKGFLQNAMFGLGIFTVV